ncbi:MAG: hypothetical protein M0Z54_02275 [Thermaerobacter sp.]|nr:hypothetical protein [Thermaerobacter sp.]
MTLLDEYHQALAEWQNATAAFEAADDAYVDYYTLRLTAAEHKLDMVLRMLKAQHTEPATLTR